MAYQTEPHCNKLHMSGMNKVQFRTKLTEKMYGRISFSKIIENLNS